MATEQKVALVDAVWETGGLAPALGAVELPKARRTITVTKTWDMRRSMPICAPTWKPSPEPVSCSETWDAVYDRKAGEFT